MQYKAMKAAPGVTRYDVGGNSYVIDEFGQFAIPDSHVVAAIAAGLVLVEGQIPAENSTYSARAIDANVLPADVNTNPQLTQNALLNATFDNSQQHVELNKTNIEQAKLDAAANAKAQQARDKKLENAAKNK